MYFFSLPPATNTKKQKKQKKRPTNTTQPQTDSVQNLRLAFNLGEEQFDIPKLLDSADVANNRVDERSVMTYVSLWHKACLEKAKPKTRRQGAAAVSSSAQSLDEKSRLDLDSLLLKKQIADLKAQLDSAHAEMAPLKSSNAELSAENQSLKGQIESLKTQIVALEEKVKAGAPVAGSSSVEKAAPVAVQPVADDSISQQQQEKLSRLETEIERLKKDLGHSQEATRKAIADADVAAQKAAGAEASASVPAAAATTIKVTDTGAIAGEESHSNLQDAQKTIDSLHKELEETQAELENQKKKSKKSSDKSAKKKYEKSLKKKDRELEKLQSSTSAEIRAKNEEIKILKSQLSKAQQTIREAVPEEQPADSAILSAFELVRAEFEELTAIAQILEEDEQFMSKKNTKKSEDDSDADDKKDEQN